MELRGHCGRAVLELEKRDSILGLRLFLPRYRIMTLFVPFANLNFAFAVAACQYTGCLYRYKYRLELRELMEFIESNKKVSINVRSNINRFGDIKLYFAGISNTYPVTSRSIYAVTPVRYLPVVIVFVIRRIDSTRNVQWRVTFTKITDQLSGTECASYTQYYEISIYTHR